MNFFISIFRRLLPQKSEAEKIAIALRSASKQVRKLPDGCFGVCTRFVKFTGNNELFKDLHLIDQDELGVSKLNVSCAGLVLLTAVKNGTFKGLDENLAMDLARFSFIQSSIILTKEELRQLFSTSPDELARKRAELINKNTEAWEMWSTSELSILNKCFPL